MSLSFTQFAAGQTKIQHANGCSLVFMVTDYAANTETLYSVKADGSFRVSKPVSLDDRKACNTCAGRTWSACDEVPGNAEFIGHYHV